MKNYANCKNNIYVSYKCSYENNKIILDELDAYIEDPFNVENLFCENDYTKNRLKRMIESCLK